MNTIFFILIALVAILITSYIAYQVGKSDTQEELLEIGKKEICRIFSKAESFADLQNSTEQVSSVGSALLSLGLIKAPELIQFTTSHIEDAVIRFQEAKSKASAEAVLKKQKAFEEEIENFKKNPTEPAELNRDIIRTKKKGVTRKVVRDSKGHFVKKAPHSKSEGRRLSAMKKHK